MSEKIYYPTDIKYPAFPFEEEHENTSVISKFEDGSQQSRTYFTRSRRIWTLTYTNIPRKDYLKLMHFVKDIAKFSANAFYWVVTDSIDFTRYKFLNPYEEEVFVRITNVGKWSNKVDNSVTSFWSGTIELTEV